MSTILGPLPCQACRQPVAIVRRTVEEHCRCVIWKAGGISDVARRLATWGCDHTHAIPDVAWTVVDPDGARHLCEAAAA